MAESIAEFIMQNFEAHRDECAFRQRLGYRWESFTYGQALDLAVRVEHELERQGISKGDRAMLWGENTAEWAAAFLACAIRGVVVVPMDDGASIDFALRVCKQVQARAVITSRSHQSAVSASSLPVIVLEDVPHLSLNKKAASTSAMPARDDVLQVVFTSGTTAEPKGVVITQGNALANIAPLESEIRAYLKYERYVHPIRFLNLLPLSHVFGQFLGLFLPPILGGTVIFQNDLKPSEIISTIRRERVSVLVSVPRVLQSLKQKVERDFQDEGQTDDFRRRLVGANGKH